MRAGLDSARSRLPLLGFALDVQERFTALGGRHLASAVTLAGFLAILPLLLLGTAVLGLASDSADLPSRTVEELGITGDAAQFVTDLFDSAQSSIVAASIIGVAGLLWTGLGLAAAVQYAYNTAWDVPTRGLKGKLVGLGWLIGAGLLFLASVGVTGLLLNLAGGFVPVGVLGGLATGTGLFLWTSKVLPNREVDWRSAITGALFAATGFEVLKVLGSTIVPRLVASSSALYGTFGVVFALLAWILLLARIVVYSAMVEAVSHERRTGVSGPQFRILGTKPPA